MPSTYQITLSDGGDAAHIYHAPNEAVEVDLSDSSNPASHVTFTNPGFEQEVSSHGK